MDCKKRAEELLINAQFLLSKLERINNDQFKRDIDEYRLITEQIRKSIGHNESDENHFNSVARVIPTTYNGPRSKNQWIEAYEKIIAELEYITSH